MNAESNAEPNPEPNPQPPAEPIPAPQAPLKSPRATLPFYRNNVFLAIVLMFVAVFALRLLMSNIIQGHPTDIVNFKAWSLHAAQHPFQQFYKSVNDKAGIWADYPPLYILVLWLMGKIFWIFDHSMGQWQGPVFTLLMKLPSILADLGCMAFFILILKRYIPLGLACLGALIFGLHPAVIYESTLWGQIDSITLLLQLAAIWMMIKQDYAAAILMTTLNILVKPQGLILLPLVLAVTVYRKQYTHLAVGIGSSLVVTFVLTAMFVPIPQIPSWLWDQYGRQAVLYPFSSIQAFNLWSLSGMWASDVSRGVFGLGDGAPTLWVQHKTWGLILFALAYAFSLYFFWKNDKKGTPEGINLWHTSSLIMIAFFMLPTRMHERYLYSGLFLLLGSWMMQKRLKWPFILMSISFMINLLYELPGHKAELKFADAIYFFNDVLDGRYQPVQSFYFLGKLTEVHLPVFQWYKLFSIANLMLFAWVIYILVNQPLREIATSVQASIDELLLVLKKQQNYNLKGWIPAPIALDRQDVVNLGFILFGTAILKLWRLGFPPEMVFDEVYHARAAGEYLIAVKPLEWVHPPLAKLIISIGVYFYQLTGVGWRVVPVIAGTMLLASVYCLGRFTLPQRWQALIATLMLACDGVYFVQSRMAMTNIFATCFQVTALMLTWRFIQYYWHSENRKRVIVYFLITVFMSGLSLATRWTSLYSYGFIILAFGFIIMIPSTIRLAPAGGMPEAEMPIVESPEVDEQENLLPVLLPLRVYLRQALDGFTGLLSRVRWTLNGKVAGMWVLMPLITLAIPAILYLIAYTPFFVNYGYDLPKVLQEQVNIWNYHKNLTDPHPYYSAWYTWPWLGRPTWYYFQSYANNLIGGILAIGNPAIWWFSMPCVLTVICIGLLRRKLNILYLGVACLFMYLPWGMSPRTLNYAHYFFEAVPYACLSAAALMGFVVNHYKQKGVSLAAAYFGLVVFMFVLFYPIYSALPIPGWYYNLLRWFPTWV